MKIRNGFVSNSSSSSFLLVGFNTKDLSKEEIIKMEEKGYDSHVEGEFIGQSWEVCEYEIESVNFNDISKAVKEIKSILGGSKNVQVFFGSEYS